MTISMQIFCIFMLCSAACFFGLILSEVKITEKVFCRLSCSKKEF